MVRPSPSNVLCWRCGKQTALPRCPQCQAIQALPESLDAFQIVGVEPKLGIEDTVLREALIARSRAVHPDQFANAPSPEPQYALQWSTALNRAHQTLKNRNSRTRYVLDQCGSEPAPKPPVPMELAETYFELQDVLQETGSAEHLLRFQKDLLEKKAALDRAWISLAAAFDGENAAKPLKELESWLVEQKYLSSMLSDIESKV